jgi:hypothetical protein
MTKFTIFALLALWPLMALQAAEVDVYSGEAVVSGQGSAERRSKLPETLVHVLGRWSGLRRLEEQPAAAEAVQNAQSYLVSFHYQSVELPLSDGSSQEQLRLIAAFAPPRVDELAHQLQLPLWPPERRPLEIWVVIEEAGQRRVMPLEFVYLRPVLDDIAHRRGLPLRWPEPDEDGMYPVDLQLLWGGYTEDLANPRGDGILILAARREGLDWRVRANLGFKGENLSWRIRDIDLQAAMSEGLQLAVDQVAHASAIVASDLGTWRHELTVSGLRGEEDYQECLAYLEGISIVESVSVVAARPSGVTFGLTLNALPQYLEDAINGAAVLEAEGEDGGYRYTGGRP